MKSSKTGKYVHIKKLCNNNSHLEMLAIDQRPPRSVTLAISGPSPAAS